MSVKSQEEVIVDSRTKFVKQADKIVTEGLSNCMTDEYYGKQFFYEYDPRQRQHKVMVVLFFNEEKDG